MGFTHSEGWWKDDEPKPNNPWLKIAECNLRDLPSTISCPGLAQEDFIYHSWSRSTLLGWNLDWIWGTSPGTISPSRLAQGDTHTTSLEQGSFVSMAPQLLLHPSPCQPHSWQPPPLLPSLGKGVGNDVRSLHLGPWVPRPSVPREQRPDISTFPIQMHIYHKAWNGRVLTPHEECDECLHTGKFSGTEVEVAGIKHGIERDGELTSQWWIE